MPEKTTTDPGSATAAPLDQALLAGAILSSALDCIVVSDDQGRIVEFNAAAERTFGWTRGQILGQTMEATIVPPRHREAHRRGMERYLSGGAAAVVGRRVEIEAMRSDGLTFPVELSITETYMGACRYFVATLRDISRQKTAEDDLRQARASLQAIFDNIPAALYLRDRQDNLVMINTWGAQFLGRDPAEMIGQPMSKFREPQNTAGVREADEKIARTGKPETREFTYHLPGGDRVGLMTFFPVSDGKHDITQIGGMLMDVTDLHRARVELQEARATLEAFFDHVPVGVFINRVGPNGIADQEVVFANDNLGKFHGLTAGDLIGLRPYEADDNDLLQFLRKVDGEIAVTKKPFSVEMLNPRNNRHESYTRFPILNAAGEITHIGGMQIDIDERVRSKQQLDEVKALLESIFDNVPAVLYLRELDGRFMMINKYGAVVVGRDDPADLIGAMASDYDTEEERGKAIKTQALVLSTGRPATQEYRRKTPDGEVIVLNTIFPIKDAEGNIVRMGGFATDVTELYSARSQLQRAQESLHQSEKLAALGQLLAGVAHELNNPLAVVLGRAAILQEKLVDTPHAASLQKLREAATRCARIVKTFLAMARQTGPRRQRVEVNELIESALEMTTYGLRSVDITWNAAPLATAQTIEADEDQIIQVVINLILNAQHALTNKAGPRNIDIRADVSPDRQWLHIAVADNGPGVPDAIASRIFDPFFTTKDVGQGTGLGLSVCKSMAEAHGGRLELTNTPGGGATFTLILPIESAEGLNTETAGEAGDGHKVRGRILVIDDEVEIAAILADCLTPLGIDCVIATDGKSALQHLSEASFDGIFCDISMPGMDGISFYNRVKDIYPHLAQHLVFVSGNVLHHDWDRVKATVDRPMIEKPFDPQQVRDAALLLLARKGLHK